MSNRLPVTEPPMPRRLPASAQSLADFFSRALASFQSSTSQLQIICTAVPTPNHGHPAPLPPRFRPLFLVVLDSSFNPPTRAHQRMATSAIRCLTERQGQGLNTVRLLLLLSVNNADKGAKPAAFDKRLAMMWAFARNVQDDLRGCRGSAAGGEHVPDAGEEGLSVDLGLATVPYFHDKSAALAESRFYSGEDPGDDGAAQTEQVFLVGFDTLIRIFNPKYYGPSEPTSQLSSVDSSPMQKALDPFFGRSKLRVTMRTGDEWGDENEQREYLETLLGAEGLSGIGGNTDWGDRIKMVQGREVGADIVSSTYARAAAKEGDAERLVLMVTPEVGRWIEQGELYS